MNDDSHNQQRQATDPLGGAEDYRLFETAVSRFLGRFMGRDSIDATETEDEIHAQDIDTSGMPPLEHITDANPNATSTTSQLPQASSSSSGMDVDIRETAVQVTDTQNASDDVDDMPGLLDVSDSEDSDADDVEMLVMDNSDTESLEHAHFADMPPLEPIPSSQPQQVSNRLPSQPVVSASTANPVSEASSSSGSNSSRRAYVEDDPENEEMQSRERALAHTESDNDTVRIGSRRPRVVDEDDEDGRRSMRSTNNATPVPPTPAPPSRTATPPVSSNTPNIHRDRPVRPLPRNGPPPTHAAPPGVQAFDPNDLFRQFFSMFDATMNAVQPGAQVPGANASQPAAADNNGAQAGAQPVPNSDREAPPTAGTTPNADAEQDNEDGQDVAFDMFFHFIAPDGNITTQRAGNRAQASNQNNTQNANQPQQGEAQNPNPNPRPMPGFVGGFLEQMLRAAAQGGLEEREDPERAKKLVAGLEIVSDGLVKRLERVGGAPGTHEDMLGDPGCAICWDSLLHSEEDEIQSKDLKKESGDDKTKADEASASETTAAAPVPAPAVQDTAAASSPSPTPEASLPGSGDTSGGASVDLKADLEEEVQKEDLRIVALPCAHVFHAKCLIPWFSRPNQTTCPVCRFNIDPENLTYRSRPLRAHPPPPRPARQRAAAPAQAEAQQTPPATAQMNQQEAQPPQPQTAPAGVRPATPQAVQPNPQPQPQVRTTYTFGFGNGNGGNPAQLPPFFSVNLDLIVDGTGGFRFAHPPNNVPQPQAQPNLASQPQAAEQQSNEQPDLEQRPDPAPPAPAAPTQASDANAQTAHAAGAANSAGFPQDGARLLNFGTPLNFFNPTMPFGLGPGIGMGFGMGVPRGAAHPHPHPQRERKEWTVPAAPGLTLRERVEKKEREAGLRCSDVSCGIGPTDEDPTPDALADAIKQISISRDGASGKEPVCEHLFHPACLVSAGRIAGWGQQDDSGDEVEVSCPVCRKAGHVDRLEWEEGVRESLA